MTDREAGEPREDDACWGRGRGDCSCVDGIAMVEMPVQRKECRDDAVGRERYVGAVERIKFRGARAQEQRRRDRVGRGADAEGITLLSNCIPGLEARMDLRPCQRGPILRVPASPGTVIC
jgi:hypothetical protein